MKKILIPIIVVIVLAALFFLTKAAPQKIEPVTFTIFGTFGQLELQGDREKVADVNEEILVKLQHFNDTINTYDKNSEVTKLNQTPANTPFKCSQELWDIIIVSEKAYHETHGAFDITVQPIIKLWKKQIKLNTFPTQEQIDTAKAQSGFDKVMLNKETREITFTVDGMSLNFGGIAKGYGLDLAAGIAAKHGINRGIINLGGNIMCLDQPSDDREYYNIGIRNPNDKETMLQTVQLKASAIATSGNYEQYKTIEGKEVHHIINPATGRPLETHYKSVSVISRNGVDTDVFATAITISGEPLIKEFLKKDTTLEIICVLDNNTVESYSAKE